MGKSIHLKKFNDSELIFDDQETIEILKFIFKNKRDTVEALTVDRELREFPQGLLVEAIDASYAMGFIEALVRSVARPQAGIRNIIKKFGKKASKHWFKHATASDLRKIEIYERVREQLELNFARILRMHRNGTAGNLKVNAAFIAYTGQRPRNLPQKVWKLT